MNNLILCGFMGCGKTTVGRLVAQLAGMAYLDLDQQIEAAAGLPIPEIFARFGQAHFRRLEHEAVAGLARLENRVVATGGGALVSPENAAAIDREHDRVVFLDVPFPVCYERIRLSDRPLVRQNTVEQLEALFASRRPRYLAAATDTVAAAGPPQQVAQEILALAAHPPACGAL